MWRMSDTASADQVNPNDPFSPGSMMLQVVMISEVFFALRSKKKQKS